MGTSCKAKPQVLPEGGVAAVAQAKADLFFSVDLARDLLKLWRETPLGAGDCISESLGLKLLRQSADGSLRFELRETLTQLHFLGCKHLVGSTPRNNIPPPIVGIRWNYGLRRLAIVAVT